MHRVIGLTASILVTASTVCFAVAIIAGAATVSYGSSLILAWAYVALVGTLAVEAGEDRKSAGQTGMAFGVLYAAFATSVYFIQLTTVAHGTASSELLISLSYRELGSLMFNLDLLAYGLMAMSTFFIGLSMNPNAKPDRVLRLLLLFHGAFAPVTLLLPILNVFGTMTDGAGAATGVLILFAWCLYFTPIGVLAIYHFRAREGDP
jgi:hypothetical protein